MFLQWFRIRITRPATLIHLAVLPSFFFAAAILQAQPAIRFDLAPLAVAQADSPSEVDTSDADSAEAATSLRGTSLPGQRLVRIPLRISALVDSPERPRIDQVMVQIYCLDAAASVVDYAPRTAVASPFEGNLEVTKTAERNKHLGFAVNGAYGKMLEGNIGGDTSKKDLETVKFQRVAPVEVVAASGTLGRGRGVYFKLRSTALQVLEGEKQFEVVLSVPQHWQSGLLDVQITAETNTRILGGLDSEIRCVGRADFVVAAFLDDVPHVRAAALSLVESEAVLRRAAAQHRQAQQAHGNRLFRQVAQALDFGQREIRGDWMVQIMRGTLDPHLDQEIRGLPMDVRIAILDYQAAQRNFLQAATPAEQTLASH